MKKRITVLSAILVLALVLSGVFMLLTSAESEVEARLALTPAGGSSASFEGTFDEMVEKLNSSVATLGAGKATLTLCKNASATKQIAFTGTGAETVVIDLGGNSLDLSAVNESTPGAAIAVSSLASLEILGGVAADLEAGELLSEDAASGIVMIDNVASSKIDGVYMSYAATAEGVYGVAQRGTGSLYIARSDLAYSGDKAASPVLLAADTAALTLNDVSIADLKTAGGSSVGVSVKGSTVRFENSSVKADVAYLMNGGTWLTAVDTELAATSAIFAANGASGDVVNSLGVTLKGNILGEGATKDMIKLWYGTGSTLILGDDPSASVTVATSLAALAEAESGKWTLTSSSETESIYTIATDRAAKITEGESALGASINAGAQLYEAPTAVAIAMLKDASYETSTVSFVSTETANGTASTFFDLNGHRVTQIKNTNLFGAGGNVLRLSIDGMDALGNRGGIDHTGYTGGAFYGKGIVATAEITFRNFELNHRNGGGKTGSCNYFQLQDAHYYFDGVRILFSGDKLRIEDSYYVGSIGKYTAHMITLQSTATLDVRNCEFVTEPTGAAASVNVPIIPTVVNATKSNTVYLKDCKLDGVGTVVSASTSMNGISYVTDCVIKSGAVPFTGGSQAAHVKLSDCEITIGDSAELTNGVLDVLLGEGKLKIFTSASSVSGTHTLPPESTLVFDTKSEAYVIITGDSISTVKLNKLFANGMVFQAGKPVNVYGTCEEDGSVVRVTLGDKSAEATVSGGKWFATLPAFDYAKDLTLTVEELDKQGSITYKDIDIGEVWVMAGQSNANLGAYKLEDFDEYLALADNYDNIRCFSVKAALSDTELDDFATARWYDVNSKTLPKSFGDDGNTGISAVAYVMATKLAVELEGNVTIAVVDVNYNGKAISNFINNNYDPGAKTADVEHGIYNAMIAPFVGYNIKGFGWYQGEATADSGECTTETDGKYGLNVDQLYATFTETFNVNEGSDPLELFIIQLSAYMSNPQNMRTYQQAIAAGNEHYHLVSCSWAGSVLSKYDFALDAGDGFQYGHVHSARKSPMGIALADSILENVYFKDEGVKLASPEIESVVANGSTISVTLDRDFLILFGDEVTGFEVAGADKVFHAATGKVEGRTITLSSASVSAPLYVRYGYGKSLIEFDDGQVMEFIKDYFTANPASNKATSVTVTTPAGTVVIDTSDPAVIRSILPGNIISTSGHSLAVFSTAVESSSANQN